MEPQLRGGELYKYQERRGEKMKYVFFIEFKEPVDENMKKANEIEKERMDKGEAWSQQSESLAQYRMLSSPKGFMIVDTDDPSKIAKWITSYAPVIKFKISPIMTEEEWEKATQ